MSDTNPMVSAVSRYEEAARAAEIALDAMYASFGIENRRIVSVGGAMVPGSGVHLRGVRVMLDEAWRVEKHDGFLARLYVGCPDDELYFGIIESERLCDGFGHVGYVGSVIGDDHCSHAVLVVLTGMMESK